MELEKFCLQRRGLPLVSEARFKSVTNTLNITRPRSLLFKVTEVDDDENVVVRPDFQSAVRASYTNRMLLFLSTRWTAPRLDLKRLTSGGKGTMSMHIELKRRRNTTEVLEAALAASAVSTK